MYKPRGPPQLCTRKNEKARRANETKTRNEAAREKETARGISVQRRTVVSKKGESKGGWLEGRSARVGMGRGDPWRGEGGREKARRESTTRDEERKEGEGSVYVCMQRNERRKERRKRGTRTTKSNKQARSKMNKRERETRGTRDKQGREEERTGTTRLRVRK
ncbi:hypothetical protein BDY24DRAFT_238964 [Mrakia frigida]|uniref:uncharacterized protein n=1 Tax=Mrakia frigida TaxID=29902 RepID=UPI003FCC0FF3